MTAPQKSAPALNTATVGLSLLVGGIGVWTVLAGPTELLPIHYNAAGQADDWGSRELVGGALVGLALLTLLLGGGNRTVAAHAAGVRASPSRSEVWHRVVVGRDLEITARGPLSADEVHLLETIGQLLQQAVYRRSR